MIKNVFTIFGVLLQVACTEAFLSTGVHQQQRHVSCGPLYMATVDAVAGKERLRKFLEDCELLGPVRFVALTEGAILEAVGSFDNLRYTELEKGTYATVSDGDSTFEAHLNCDRVASVNMLTKPNKEGTSELYITRFSDGQGNTLLSATLHAGEGGDYEDGAVAYWKKLQGAFGEQQQIS